MPKKTTEKKLTAKQDEIFDYIKERIISYGFPPTVREIGESFGITVKGAYDHLKAIEKKGFIRTEQNKSRAIVILNQDNDRSHTDAINIPLVGTIAAGSPILADENIQGYLSFPKSVFSGNDYFALKIKGDSMIEAGINDGDIAIIRKQQNANNGDIVAALIEGEATLKRFKSSGGKINLMPENPSFKPIVVDEVDILGKLAAVFRKY